MLLDEEIFRNFCNTNNFQNIKNIKCYFDINGLFILLSNLIPRQRKYKNVKNTNIIKIQINNK